jgi:hypothetical protein
MSRLARRLIIILPAITLADALETTRRHNVAGLTDGWTALVTTRPFRASHHTISDVGQIGGGQVPMPGEVSLAHNGVRFLDELPEFRRHVLEVLRQPLEESPKAYNLAGVADLTAAAALAAQLETPTSSHTPCLRTVRIIVATATRLRFAPRRAAI